jgi:hypothetical protein
MSALFTSPGWIHHAVTESKRCAGFHGGLTSPTVRAKPWSADSESVSFPEFFANKWVIIAMFAVVGVE